MHPTVLRNICEFNAIDCEMMRSVGALQVPHDSPTMSPCWSHGEPRAGCEGSGMCDLQQMCEASAVVRFASDQQVLKPGFADSTCAVHGCPKYAASR